MCHWRLSLASHTQTPFLEVNLRAVCLVSRTACQFFLLHVYPVVTMLCKWIKCYDSSIFFLSIVDLQCCASISVEQSDSNMSEYIYTRPPTHMYIYFHSLFSYRLLQNIGSSSLCYTGGPCWVSIYVRMLSPFLFYASMPFSFGNCKFVFYVCKSVSVL